MSDVKKRVSRKEKAAATRRRMLLGAYEVFCEEGFRAATMEAIAERAEVAVQTLYFTFRTKDGLLQEVHEWTVLGDDPVPPPLQPWYQAVLSEPDAERALEILVDGLVTILSRVAPMVPVFEAVRGDEAGEVWARAEKLRREGMKDLVDGLVRKQPLRRGLTKRQAVDLLVVLGGPATYRALVVDSGWSPKQWSIQMSRSLQQAFYG